MNVLSAISADYQATIRSIEAKASVSATPNQHRSVLCGSEALADVPRIAAKLGSLAEVGLTPGGTAKRCMFVRKPIPYENRYPLPLGSDPTRRWECNEKRTLQPQQLFRWRGESDTINPVSIMQKDSSRLETWPLQLTMFFMGLHARVRSDSPQVPFGQASSEILEWLT
ncbi:MAG TPA: hypothetical protein VIU12_16660, partial [Chryseolinea sp.]